MDRKSLEEAIGVVTFQVEQPIEVRDALFNKLLEAVDSYVSGLGIVTNQDILKKINIQEAELEAKAWEYARQILEGEGDEVSGQKIADHMDAAKGIMEDFKNGYSVCLARISDDLGIPLGDNSPPPTR